MGVGGPHIDTAGGPHAETGALLSRKPRPAGAQPNPRLLPPPLLSSPLRARHLLDGLPRRGDMQPPPPPPHPAALLPLPLPLPFCLPAAPRVRGRGGTAVAALGALWPPRLVAVESRPPPPSSPASASAPPPLPESAAAGWASGRFSVSFLFVLIVI